MCTLHSPDQLRSAVTVNVVHTLTRLPPDIELGGGLLENIDLDTQLVSSLFAEAGESVRVDVLNVLRISHVIIRCPKIVENERLALGT